MDKTVKEELRKALKVQMENILNAKDEATRKESIENAARIRNLMTADRDTIIGYAIEGSKVVKDIVLGAAGLAAWVAITYGGYRMEYVDNRVPTSSILRANMLKPGIKIG